jgi:hypothetical protein
VCRGHEPKEPQRGAWLGARWSDECVHTGKLYVGRLPMHQGSP